MARRTGIKQDAMLYKVRVFCVNQHGEEVTNSITCGAYEAIGTARNVGSAKANRLNREARLSEQRLGVKTGLVWRYEVIRGRLVWFEKEK